MLLFINNIDWKKFHIFGKNSKTIKSYYSHNLEKVIQFGINSNLLG